MAQINRQNNLAAALGGATGEGLNKAIMNVLENITRNKIRDVEGRQTNTPQSPNPTLEALSTLSETPQQNTMQQLQQDVPQELSIQNALQSLSPQESAQEAPKRKVQEKPQKKSETSGKKPKVLSKEDKAASRAALKLIDQPTPLTPANKLADKIDENPDPMKHKAVENKQDEKIKKLPKLSEKQQLAADKETKGYFDDISKAYKAAREGNMRLDRMVELIRVGRLTWPHVASFLDTLERGLPLWESHIGIDLHSLESDDAQEFRKLSTDFVKNAKDIFGARVTNQDLTTFLKTIPTLSQTDGGKLRVIRNMRLFNDTALLKKKAMDEIINENGGERPRNIEALVDERIADQLDVLAKQFSEGTLNEKEAEAMLAAKNRLY